METRWNGVQWIIVRLWVEDRLFQIYRYHWVTMVTLVVAALASPHQAKSQEGQNQYADHITSHSYPASMRATNSISMNKMSARDPFPQRPLPLHQVPHLIQVLSLAPLLGPLLSLLPRTLSLLTALIATQTVAAMETPRNVYKLHSVNASHLHSPAEPYHHDGIQSLRLYHANGTHTTLSTTSLIVSISVVQPTTTGRYNFTKTNLPVSGHGTLVWGCISIYTTPNRPCHGHTLQWLQNPPHEHISGDQNAHGSPMTPSYSSPARPQEAASQGCSDNYIPSVSFCKAVISLFWGCSCSESNYLLVTGITPTNYGTHQPTKCIRR